MTLRSRSAWNFSPRISANHSDVVVDVGLVAFDQQQAERRQLGDRAAAARRGTARFRAAFPAAAGRGGNARGRPLQADGDERIAAIVEVEDELAGARRWRCRAPQCPTAARDRSPPWPAGRAPDADVPPEPLEPLLSADRGVDAAQQELGERELGLGLDHVARVPLTARRAPAWRRRTRRCAPSALVASARHARRARAGRRRRQRFGGAPSRCAGRDAVDTWPTASAYFR